MGSPGPTRGQGDLADVVEMLLDKGVVINADIAVSVGDTELLGVQVRAALASFETAAEYGLEFPEGTDMDRVEEAAAGRSHRQVESGEAADDEEERDGGTDGDEATERVEVERTEEGATDDAADSSPSGPNRVAARPHTSAGDGGSGGEGGSGGDEEAASEEDDGDG